MYVLTQKKEEEKRPTNVIFYQINGFRYQCLHILDIVVPFCRLWAALYAVQHLNQSDKDGKSSSRATRVRGRHH